MGGKHKFFIEIIRGRCGRIGSISRACLKNHFCNLHALEERWCFAVAEYRGRSGRDSGKRRNTRSRKKRKQQRRRILVSALIEVIILLLLAGAFCWERGLKARVIGLAGYFDGPPVKKLDVMGVNSSNVILMDAKSGKIIGNLNGEERIYPASMTKIMTAIVALETFSDLDRKITLSEDIFYTLNGQDATQAGFQPRGGTRFGSGIWCME